jgi:hypothetical protein
VTLTKVAWSVFALDVVLGAVMVIAALSDGNDAAGSGLAEVYMVGCVIALVAFGVLLGLSTYFRSTIGLLISIAIMVAPPLLLAYGVARQLSY